MKYKIIALLCLLFMLCGCVNESNIEKKLKGTWYNEGNNEYIRFNGDGTVYYTFFVEPQKKNITFLSLNNFILDDTVYDFSFKFNTLIINDNKFYKVDNNDMKKYLTIESSYDNPKDEISYSSLAETLEKIGYLNYINEYYKILDVPVEKSNFESKEKTINLVCQIKNKYYTGIQMNENNCVILEKDNNGK